MSPSRDQCSIARNVPQPTASQSKPYGKPARAKVLLIHRCKSCGDYILPSELRAFRAQSRDALAAPDSCWACAELEIEDDKLLRSAR